MVGVHNVVQVCTENALVMTVASRHIFQPISHLYVQGCAAHCLDPFLEECVKKLVNKARIISVYIKSHHASQAIFRRLSPSLSIRLLIETRFATNFIMTDRLLQVRNARERMIIDDEWSTLMSDLRRRSPTVYVKAALAGLSGRPLKSGLRQLYPKVKSRASSGWGRFSVSVLRMAVPTGESVPARLRRRSPGRRHSQPPGGRLCFPGGRPPTQPHVGLRRPSLRPSDEPSARPSTRPSAGPTARRTASSLIPAPGSPPPPLPTVPSTVGFLGEYKEGSTNTLNLLPNLCFPRALSCTLHLLLGKPLLRKSEIVLGVSFETPNTISTAWLLHSFILYFCPHRNGQQTMVPLVH